MTAPNAHAALGQAAGTAFFEAPHEANQNLTKLAELQERINRQQSFIVDQRHEIDDQATLLRQTNELNAGLAKWAEIYQTERDNLRDDLDGMRDERDEAVTRAQELEAENTALREQLAQAQGDIAMGAL